MSGFSNRRTTVYRFGDDSAAVLRGLEEDAVDLVVLDQLGFGTTQRYLLPVPQDYPERFELLHTTAEPKHWVLRFE